MRRRIALLGCAILVSGLRVATGCMSLREDVRHEDFETFNRYARRHLCRCPVCLHAAVSRASVCAHSGECKLTWWRLANDGRFGADVGYGPRRHGHERHDGALRGDAAASKNGIHTAKYAADDGTMRSNGPQYAHGRIPHPLNGA